MFHEEQSLPIFIYKEAYYAASDGTAGCNSVNIFSVFSVFCVISHGSFGTREIGAGDCGCIAEIASLIQY